VLPGRLADRDLTGNERHGTASTTVNLAPALRVRLQGGEKSTFTIAGAFLTFPAFQRPGIPIAGPATPAASPSASRSKTASIRERRFVGLMRVQAAEEGTLTVVTRQVGNGDAPDLVLEVYTGGNFGDAQDRSDQDLQGNSASESVTVQVKAGEAVHVRVSGNFSNAAKYRLSSSLAP
jgi:hypothetical protein